MALQFDSGAYGQAYNLGQENELKNKYQGIEALMRLSQQLSQTGKSMTEAGQARQQQEQQQKLYELQLDEAQRKKRESDLDAMTNMELLSGNKISSPVVSTDMMEKLIPPSPIPSFGQPPVNPNFGEAALPQDQQIANQSMRPSLMEQFRNFQAGGKLRPQRMDIGESVQVPGQPYQAMGPQPEPDISAQLSSLGLPPQAAYWTQGQTKKFGENKKLFADAGQSDYYTPEQVKAIYPQGEGLSEAFGGRVPKSAVSTAALAGSRQENRELRKEQFGEQLDKETKTRYRNYLLDIEQRDPVIKEMNKQSLSLGQMQEMVNLARGGNTVASSVMGTKMARAMGEVGVLTESDIIRYVQSGQLTRGAADKLSRMLTGAPTETTLEEISQIGNVLQDTFATKIQPRYDNYINSYSKIERISPEDFAGRLSLPYGGSSRAAGTGLMWNGRPLKDTPANRAWLAQQQGGQQ